MSTEDERMQILEMIERGEISPSQGLELLNALESVEPSQVEAGSFPGPAEVYPLPEAAPEAGFPLEDAPAPSPEPLLDAAGVVFPAPGREPPGQGLPEGYRASAWEAETPGAREDAAPAGERAARAEVVPPVTRLGPDFSRWRSFWQFPLWVGVGITILSGLFMFLAWQSRGVGLLFACTWFPFLLGVAVMALAWSTRNLPWLHVRVQQKAGERPERIAISLPLPLSVIGWALRTFKHKIPNTGNVNLDEMVMSLKHVTPDAPFSVDVDEGEDGERVQIYIG